MPLKGRSQGEGSASKKAAQTFARLEKDFSRLPRVTEIVSFRVPIGEKERLRQLFGRQGKTLTTAVKEAVYEYARKLDPLSR